jgi:hypothetical protein
VPSGIRRATVKGLISLELFKSINTLCSVFIENNGRTPSTLADAIKLTDKRKDLEQNLTKILQGPSRIVSEECCALAILIYKHITLGAMPSTTTLIIGLSRDLKHTLEQTDLSLYWSGEVNLLLWVLFIGYVSSHMQAEKSWFASLIRGLVLNTNYRVEVDGLKKIFQDFLYSEAHFGSLYVELWTWLVKNS